MKLKLIKTQTNNGITEAGGSRKADVYKSDNEGVNFDLYTLYIEHIIRQRIRVRVL